MKLSVKCVTPKMIRTLIELFFANFATFQSILIVSERLNRQNQIGCVITVIGLVLKESTIDVFCVHVKGEPWFKLPLLRTVLG